MKAAILRPIAFELICPHCDQIQMQKRRSVSYDTWSIAEIELRAPKIMQCSNCKQQFNLLITSTQHNLKREHKS